MILKMMTQMQRYFWFANFIFVSHCGLGVFYLIGWYFVDLQGLYLFLMTLWIGSWLLLGYCPLSRWEFGLRQRYDASIDPETEIIQFYIKKFLGYDLTSSVIVRWGIVVYMCLILLSFVKKSQV